MNIITGKLMPDEGKIEWSKNVRIGYLDQHSVLLAGMTIEDVLKSAFSWLFQMEERMNSICDQLGDASPEEMENLMEELRVIAAHAIDRCSQNGRSDWSVLKANIKNDLSGYLFKTTKRNPMILPVIMEI